LLHSSPHRLQGIAGSGNLQTYKLSGKAAHRSFKRGNYGLFTPMPEKNNNVQVVNLSASGQLKYDMDRAIGDMVVKKLKGWMGKYRQ